MKNIKFLLLGIFFAIVLSKSQAISWFRFYEMFRFQSFHMFGIIGGAVVISAIFMQLFKRGIIKDIHGNIITPKKKEKGVVRTLVGGTFFGIGWGISGACAGPIFVILGFKFLPALILLISALFGAFIYGLLSKKLPN
ncbi:MAG: YeeE/YedE family protein [Flavobacteriia bacterium]|nr:YeeE/YedE family protein [Flavobacteriia bacterium]OIP46452.1 MAG: transporter [Flavobacteriaceae bacterium CG2_30_31_66]PIV96562.1 MAG: transporter [Flavobacteriaceae bacterium CG17_big_fil_post_rev_8_21_14_2_50_31_13]PIX10956.1 MAG: transporter [Flavobacteriaceae bacterium CG_4_8_14_3_um_filter_31_8]PIY16084.1 MAG: transporter [Flavobacteriaceae bacterium CG_4_10_14_3_um_filter_31_253]PIZ09933.1 MAG: transporter [Flavobacteriaceae bacterium CG_4_10_14_0_8_um_filter_31_99]PJC09379.1 MAG: 